MNKLKKLLNDPLEIGLALSGLALLGFYTFYVRKELFRSPVKKQSQNTLEMDLNELIHEKKDPNVVKIVITSSSFNNSKEFTSKLITKLNKFLRNNNQHTLVNCAVIFIIILASETFYSRCVGFYGDNTTKRS